MDFKLSNLKKLSGKIDKAKRVGRGVGSGKGKHTTGRGSKGQNSRSGGKRPIWFEGGQTPLVYRTPYKGGFRNPASKKVLKINLEQLEVLFEEKEKVTPESLAEKLNVKVEDFRVFKILGRGTLTKKLIISGFEFSKIAKEKLGSGAV